MDKLCKNCKHWDAGFGGHGPNWGTCWKASEGFADDNPMAVAEEVNSYKAWLNTREDFGCVQFEAKDHG
jgi:hypothetical protein